VNVAEGSCIDCRVCDISGALGYTQPLGTRLAAAGHERTLQWLWQERTLNQPRRNRMPHADRMDKFGSTIPPE
jgi:hypothetical protein